jgi:tRNA nucleotidyltransferase (CCA-adding enzyme)
MQLIHKGNVMKSYLVGGAVRDMLLGLAPKDSDYVVVGSTTEEMLADGFQQVGADFPVFLHPVTGDEYALARTEQKTGPGYHGFDTRFTPDITLEQDLARRDLTINSMAINELGVIVDPYGGQKDLANKVLRHTSEAFAEDPLRVLRIARFAARYINFHIDHSTLLLMGQMIVNGELNALTQERVFVEFKKGLMEKEPKRMFEALSIVGAQSVLKEYFGASPSRYEALNKASSKNEPLEVRFAIIASGFKTAADFYARRVSSECSELATLVNNNIQAIKHYEEMTSEEKVQLFNRLDFFRRPGRCQQVFSVCEYISLFTKGDHISTMVQDDLATVSLVDAGEIAKSMVDKTKIKEAIFIARVNAIADKKEKKI